MYKLVILLTLHKRKENKMAKHKVEITGINTSEIKVLTEKEKIELFKKQDVEIKQLERC